MRQGWWLPLTLAGALAAPASAQRLAYEGAASVATGEYFFTERTTSWMLASGLAFTVGRLTLRASVPLYLQNTTLVTSWGGGMMPTGGSLGGAVSDSGQARHGRGGGGGMSVPVPPSAVSGLEAALGDPLAQVSVRIVNGLRGTVALGGAVKVPLTDTSTFGTGAWDAGATLSATWWTGSGFIGLEGAYWYLGDLPDLELRDVVSGSLGVGRRFSTSWVASASLAGATSALRGYAAPVTVGVMVGRAGDPIWSVSGAVGLTETAPDLTLGLGWRVSL